MRKVFVLLLTFVLLAVPAFAAGNLVNDGEGLLSYEEAAELEQVYASYGEFTPVLVTVDSFGGLSAEDFAGRVYDQMGYPYDGILYLVSLTEGQWYILTNGACYDRISDWDAEAMGEELVEYLRDGDYYEAFEAFPQLAEQYFLDGIGNDGSENAGAREKNYGKTIAICMAVGLAIRGIAVGIMASMMKSVRPQNSAADYTRPGSMQLTNQRDIFLYSHVTRTAKPKSSSSGGSGGSRGGAGGRI